MPTAGRWAHEYVGTLSTEHTMVAPRRSGFSLTGPPVAKSNPVVAMRSEKTILKGTNGRIWAGVQAALSATVVGVGVWYLAMTCGAVADATCIFARFGELWSSVLKTGVMLAAGGLLAMTFSKMDHVLRINGHSETPQRQKTGE